MSEYVSSQAQQSGVTESSGVGLAWAGVVALVVGVFALGIPAGLAAASLGRHAAQRGSSTFGRVVQVLGWIEVVVTALLLLAIAGSQQ
jgi:hypothetical protein